MMLSLKYALFAVYFFLSLLSPFSTALLQVDVIPNSDATEREVIMNKGVTIPIRLGDDFHPISSGQDHFKRTTISSDEGINEDFLNPVYKISALGEDLIIQLHPDLDLLAPTFTTVYSWKKSSSDEFNKSTSTGRSLKECFYKGVVVGMPGSRVAMSVCDSLIGSIETEDHSYVIAPVSNDARNHDNSTPALHSVHKRSLNDLTKSKRSSSCGVREKRNRQRYRRHRKSMEEVAQSVVKKVATTKRSLSKEESEVKNSFGNTAKSRSRRSFESRQHYIETMLVADSSMVREHGEDLEHYLLSIMMLANKQFAHPSLGSAISLSVVKIMIMEEDDVDLHVSSNAGHTLRNFCAWQKQFNTPDDTDPRHFDLAVLFTKEDLCGATCDTLGMAEVGAMCSTRHSCAIVEDDGLSSSHTVAHEIGHGLNMMHDDNRVCRKKYKNLKPSSHVMSSTITRIDTEQPWSECSRQTLAEFLLDGRGDCLLDRPQRPKAYPEELPGESYGVTSQCEMTFGRGATECPYMRECSRLWCQLPSKSRANQCHTRNFPKADGSPCTPGNQCMQGKCVPRGRKLVSVDGGWSSWGQFGTCSRTCGGGVQMSSRQCNSPIPQHGGRYCIGSRMRFRSCNVVKCEEPEAVDFRREQCAVYNGQRFPRLGVRVASTWIPKYSDVFEKDRCKLICKSQQTGTYITLSDRVVDGTRCAPDTSDVCVRGQCMPAGCDGVLGSKAKYNKCGLCNVSNRHCTRVKGKYRKRLSGYHDVVTFPKGAASIKVKQRSKQNLIHDGIYLALVSSSGRYLLNGGLTLSTIKKDINVNGTILRYSGVKSVTETIISSKPLRDRVTLQVLSLSLSGAKIPSPRITFSYFIPKSLVSSTNAKVSSSHVEDSRSTINSKSRSRVRTKTRQPPSRWVVGRWKKCKAISKRKCGAGWKKRRVTCKSGKRRTTDCSLRLKPLPRLPCFVSTCPHHNPNPRHPVPAPQGVPQIVNRQIGFDQVPVWNTGMWSSCSVSCGFGTKRRLVVCQTRSGSLLSNSSCNPNLRPASVYGCKLRDCR